MYPYTWPLTHPQGGIHMLLARLFRSLSLVLVIVMLTPVPAAASATPEQQLREAAARGDAAQVSALLDCAARAFLLCVSCFRISARTVRRQERSA